MNSLIPYMRIICRENIFLEKKSTADFPLVFWIKSRLNYLFCANVIIKKTSASIQNVYNFGNMCKLKSIRLLKIVRVSLLLRWVETLRNCRYREHHTNITIWYVYTYRQWTYSGNLCGVHSSARLRTHLHIHHHTHNICYIHSQIRTIPSVCHMKNFFREWVKSVYTHNWNIQGKLRMGIFLARIRLVIWCMILSAFLWSF